MSLRLLSLALVLGCGDKEVTPTDDSSASTDDSSASTDDSSTSTDDSAPLDDTAGAPPEVSDCDACCYLNDTGDPRWIWLVQCQASDPEGPETLNNGRIEASAGGGVVFSDLVACDPQGYCTSSFRVENSGVQCDGRAGDYSFQVWVSDLAGNESAPTSAVGRQSPNNSEAACR